MKLYLIRHGETQENQQGIVMGWLDAGLNSRGKEQAAAYAESFRQQVDAIFCSDLKRCLETAEPFRNRLGDTPFFIDWRLRERYLGDAQGKAREEVFTEGSSELQATGVERLEQYRARVGSFLDSVRQLNYRFNCALVVTHNGTINRMMEVIHNADDLYANYGNGQFVALEV